MGQTKRRRRFCHQWDNTLPETSDAFGPVGKSFSAQSNVGPVVRSRIDELKVFTSDATAPV